MVYLKVTLTLGKENTDDCVNVADYILVPVCSSPSTVPGIRWPPTLAQGLSCAGSQYKYSKQKGSTVKYEADITTFFYLFRTWYICLWRPERIILVSCFQEPSLVVVICTIAQTHEHRSGKQLFLNITFKSKYCFFFCCCMVYCMLTIKIVFNGETGAMWMHYYRSLQ